MGVKELRLFVFQNIAAKIFLIPIPCKGVTETQKVFAIASFSRQERQMELSCMPITGRCLCNVKCPVNSPTGCLQEPLRLRTA